MYKRARIGAIVVLTGTLVAAGATSAMATAYNGLHGTLNCVGALSQYDTYRPHTTGPASIKLTDTDNFASSESVRFGLRAGDTQVTNSPQFAYNQFVTKSFTSASSGSSTIPGGSLAVNARLVTTASGCHPFVPSWDGNLNQ